MPSTVVLTCPDQRSEELGDAIATFTHHRAGVDATTAHTQLTR